MSGRTVVGMHGINDSGQWLDVLQNVFEPNFVFKTIRYRSYHFRGETKLFFWPWLIPLLFGTGLLALQPAFANWGTGVLALVVYVVSLADEFKWSRGAGWHRIRVSANVLLPLLPTILLATSASLPIIFALSITISVLIHEFSSSGKFGICLIIILIWLGSNVVCFYNKYNAPFAIFFALGIVIVGGYSLIVEPLLRFEQTKRHVFLKLSEALDPSERANAIAHSFGTLLITDLTNHFGIEWNRKVLVGSVVSEVYDWAILTRTRPCVSKIRNEVGRNDWVVSVAGLAAIFRRGFGLGISGRSGFQTPPNLIHTLDYHYDDCETDRPIINVPTDFNHSDPLLAARHALRHWLPFFWKLPASEYCDLLEFCGNVANSPRSVIPGKNPKDTYNQTMASIGKRVWSWLPDQRAMLDTFVRRMVKDRAVDLYSNPQVRDEAINAAVQRSIRFFAEAIRNAQGQAISRHKVKEGVSDFRQYLYPLRGLRRAVESAWKFEEQRFYVSPTERRRAGKVA